MNADLVVAVGVPLMSAALGAVGALWAAGKSQGRQDRDIEGLRGTSADHEDRLRAVETATTAAATNIEGIQRTVDRIEGKVDSLLKGHR